MENSSSIAAAIDRLATKLAALPALQGDISLKYLAAAVFVAVIGAFSAYCFNYWHWKTAKRNTNITNLSKELGALIKQLEDESVNYWIKDYDENLHHETFLAEILIKSRIRVISSIIDTFTYELSGEHYKVKVNRLRDFRRELFDLVTGDDFESKRRKSSKAKAIKISNYCANIRTTIAQLNLNL